MCFYSTEIHNLFQLRSLEPSKERYSTFTEILFPKGDIFFPETVFSISLPLISTPPFSILFSVPLLNNFNVWVVSVIAPYFAKNDLQN